MLVTSTWQHYIALTTSSTYLQLFIQLFPVIGTSITPCHTFLPNLPVEKNMLFPIDFHLGWLQTIPSLFILVLQLKFINGRDLLSLIESNTLSTPLRQI